MANTFLTRLITEREELSTKFNALGSFLKTEAFNAIATEEKARLHLQFAIMEQYVGVLTLRIQFNETLASK